MSEPTRVFDIADTLLGLAAAALDDAAAIEVTLPGKPDRRYVSLGDPVHGEGDCDDCDQLTVHVSTIHVVTRRGNLVPLPDAGPQTKVWANGVQLTVMLLRRLVAIPSDATVIPTVAALTADSWQALSEGWYVYRTVQADVIGAGALSACDNPAFGPLVSVGPDGGYGGWSFPLTVTL